MAYIFKKKFDNNNQAWQFVGDITNFFKKYPNIEVKLSLATETVSLETKEDNSSLKIFIEDYFKAGEYSPEIINLFCDGGSRGNPGPGASGYILLDSKDNVIDSGGTFFHKCTNNQAEYNSLKEGIRAALKHSINHLNIHMDSQLVVKQIKGEYKVRNPELKQLYNQICMDLSNFQTYVINFVPRKYNKKADSIVNQIIDDNLT